MKTRRYLPACIVAIVAMTVLAAPSKSPEAYGSVRSKVYHVLATCSTGKRIKVRQEWARIADAVKAGRHLCAECGRKR